MSGSIDPGAVRIHDRVTAAVRPIIAAYRRFLCERDERPFHTTHFLPMLSLQSLIRHGMCPNVFLDVSVVGRQFVARAACATAFGHLLAQLRQLLNETVDLFLLPEDR